MAVMVASFALLGMPGSALAATQSQAFRVVTYGNMPPNTRRVIALGPVTALGTEVIVPPMINNPDGSTTVKARWEFPAGNFLVTMTVSQRFLGDPVPPVCQSTANITGNYTITGGSGAYVGASGQGTVTGVGTVFAKLDVTTGTCSEDQANFFFNQRFFQGTLAIPGLT